MDDEKLSSVLSEFARTLATEFPIQGILDHLVKRIVDVLPISAAGVTLISDGSSPALHRGLGRVGAAVRALQTEVGQGPCLLAYESGEAVSVPDFANEDRFPLFGPAALGAGLAAVFTFPLRHGDGSAWSTGPLPRNPWGLKRAGHGGRADPCGRRDCVPAQRAGP